MKKKIALTIAFIVNLLSMFLNLVGIISIVFFIIGVWIPFKKQMIGTFFTWHVLTITGEISLQNSIMLAFPEFYIGLAVSAVMVIAYFIINGKQRSISWNGLL